MACALCRAIEMEDKLMTRYFEVQSDGAGSWWHIYIYILLNVTNEC